MSGQWDPEETQRLRRTVLDREAQSDRTWEMIKKVAFAFYVASSTLSQMTLVALLNYLIQGASS